ncbi:carbohydrate-binding domain-containing protein [Siphonobacter sp. SORGH_AS_0500]|uniref:carbohydrate-binding domain-containing protein n=1 Tax=Siphonobacter sp. SORGH_AS_0500 TaxID=1864824 RepID=UPI002859DAFC|nr:carbohydrate-binding domain-containing protein [Siphonobacter sp. SORGH_AS_0500]MDR6195289.1 hypothetical protein [Siphonobacter sp. SORGH_AS_0500]
MKYSNRENTPLAFRGQLILILISLLMLASCSKDNETVEDASKGASVSIDSVSTISTAIEGNTGKAESPDDLLANATFTSTVTITYGSTITVDNPLAGKGVTVTESNGDVVVNSTVSEVAYVISGTSTNGSLKVYSDKKFKLTLNGVNLTNNDGPAINIQSSKRAFIVLADNTTNSLTDGVTYTASDTEDRKATFFSEGQLIFSGNGSVTIKGNYKHAICSDDYVRVISGTITIPSAASDGIHTNDAFIADGGTLTMTTAGDGIQCEEGYIVINDGTFTINVADKGIAASYDTDTTIDPYLTINGGTFVINSSAGEGIESKSVLTINNGEFTIKTSDDGINAGTFIYINGGNLYVYSTSNDGIDSNGKLTVTGGKIISVGAGSPEEGFDCDRNTFKITGGILVGIGGATSMPTASVSTQAAVIVGGGTLNQLIHIESTDGVEALTFQIPRTYATMMFSSPKLKNAQSYKIYTGGSVTGGTNLNGLYTSGTYQKGTEVSTFTMSSLVTSVGGSTGPGGR